MKMSNAALIAGFLAATALSPAYGQSGVADRVKQRAQRLSNENSARQQGSAAPAAQPNPTPPPPDPVLIATLQNITNLQKDFVTLKTEPAQKQRLLNDLAMAPHGAKPTQASTAKLAEDLTEALAGRSFSSAQQWKLAQDIHAVFNSSHLSATQQQAIFDDVQKTLLAGDAPPDATMQVVKDLKQIALETK